MVVVVVQGTACTRVCIMVSYGLKVGYRESVNIPIQSSYANGESRVDCYPFRPHDGADLFCSRNTYIDGGAGGDVNHRRFQPGLTLNVGPIRLDLAFRDRFRRPRVCAGRRAPS
jgi:hypothetical protein